MRSVLCSRVAFEAPYLGQNPVPFLAPGRFSVVSYSTEEPNVERTSSVDGFCFLYNAPMNDLSL